MAFWGGGRKHPPSWRKIRENGKCYAYGFYTLLPQFLSISLQSNFYGAGGPEELIRDLILAGGKRNFVIFEVLSSYFSKI